MEGRADLQFQMVWATATYVAETPIKRLKSKTKVLKAHLLTRRRWVKSQMNAWGKQNGLLFQAQVKGFKFNRQL